MREPAFVTGGGGFAGDHLLRLLPRALAPSRDELDLLGDAAVPVAVREARPVVVFHLAALASMKRSWEAPRVTLVANLRMTVNLLDAVRAEAPRAAVVVAASGEVYGPPERLPVAEDAPLRPQNPYAVSKAACDLLAGQYADAFGMRIVRTRAFNHAGPGQSDEYVVGTLTRQVAEAEVAGAIEVVLRTGTPSRRATSPKCAMWCARTAPRPRRVPRRGRASRRRLQRAAAAPPPRARAGRARGPRQHPSRAPRD